MDKLKSEKGGVTVFVIIAFLFMMTLLISMYMNNVNYQITTLQAEKIIKETYGKDVNNVNEIFSNMVSYNITFHANGGTLETANKQVNHGKSIDEFPLCLREGYGLFGWFTDSSGGEEVTLSTIITSDMDLYAHWTSSKTKIGNTEYNTVADAIAAAPKDNTETTIVLLTNTEARLDIKSGQNIVIDAQNYNLESTGGNSQIVNNEGGTVHIKNGTIRMSGKNAAIDNKSGGKLIVTGGTIISTGGRAAIYNDGGTVEISGDPYIVSDAVDAYSGVTRATVQNQGQNGTITITGGTIIGRTCPGVSNNGTIIIGAKDGNVDISSPLIMGKTYGIVNKAGKTFKFYDGIVKGISGAMDRTPSDWEDNYRIDDTSTELIDEDTYHKAYLVPDV